LNEIISLTLIRCGDGLFDSIRFGTDNCPVDVFVVDTTVFGAGGGGGGGGSVGLGLGSSNL
jgi:hypothetical protein